MQNPRILFLKYKLLIFILDLVNQETAGVRPGNLYFKKVLMQWAGHIWELCSLP